MKVRIEDLSPAMRERVAQIVQDHSPEEGAPRSTVDIEGVPVAVRGHKLYVVTPPYGRSTQSNEPVAVFDESATGITTVVDDSGDDLAVVRRPNLQMPDIAFSSTDHRSILTTVYRYYVNAGWHKYLCGEYFVNDEEQHRSNPAPGVIADRLCAK